MLLCCLLATACGRFLAVEVAAVDAVPVDTPEQTLVLAADGSTIATLRFANRVHVDREDLPDVLVEALIAAEDRRFHEHGGIDARAVARAALANQRAGEVVQGGSTLTQQLVKNRYFPEAEQTLERKADEAALALQLEASHSKDEILVDYLNTVYFGAGAYGVQAAAQTYFGVDVGALDLAETALLVGLVRAPESASPHRHPERAIVERRRVLQAMAAQGALPRDELAAADARPLGVLAPPTPPRTRYPHFVELVKRQLLDDPGLGPDEAARVRRLYGGGLRIRTTIDPVLQTHAEAAARALLPDAGDPEVAIAAIDHRSGAIVALVGGRDFAVSQFDLASQAVRSPGSTFKLFALVTALSDGMRLDAPVESGPATLATSSGSWPVRSATSGPLPLDRAFAVSSNGAFARLALSLGPERIAAQARAMGITADLGTNPAMVLGGLREGVDPLQMATAYGSIANGGVLQRPHAVRGIDDDEGAPLWEPERSPWVAVEPGTAQAALQALRMVVEDGTGQAAALGERPVAGKTGTSQGNRDAWFVGSTPELTAAVWVGHREAERPLHDVRGVAHVSGGTFPAAIWQRFMARALEGRPITDFPYPDHLEQTVLVNPTSGGLATPWCPLTVERTGLPHALPDSPCTLHGPPRPVPRPASSRPPPPADDPAERPAEDRPAPSTPSPAPESSPPPVTAPPPRTPPTTPKPAAPEPTAPPPAPTPAPVPAPSPSQQGAEAPPG
jgi:membrane peptidoglycan carboxypeptidase